MKRPITSCLGLGYLPIAPGTWGSLPPAGIFVLIYTLNVPGPAAAVIFALLVILSSILCVKCSPAAIEATGKKDPGEVVIDEFAGQSMTFLPFGFFYGGPMSQVEIWSISIAGFLLFRIFDIIKPWPANKLENLPAGWGILADDLAAGVYAAIALIVGVKFWADGLGY